MISNRKCHYMSNGVVHVGRCKLAIRGEELLGRLTGGQPGRRRSLGVRADAGHGRVVRRLGVDGRSRRRGRP